MKTNTAAAAAKRAATRAVRAQFTEATGLRTYSGAPMWQQMPDELTFDADTTDNDREDDALQAWLDEAECAGLEPQFHIRDSRMTITLSVGSILTADEERAAVAQYAPMDLDAERAAFDRIAMSNNNNAK